MSRAKPKLKLRRAALVDWAKTTPRNTGGQTCGICRHPRVVADVHELVQYRRAGNSTPGLPQVLRELVARYPKAGLTFSALYRHVAQHEGGWGGRS